MVDRVRRVRSGVPGLTEKLAERSRLRQKPAAPDGGQGRVVDISGGQWDGAPEVVLPMLKKGAPVLREFRHGKYVHVSDVIGKCARKIALQRRLNLPPPSERINDGHGITYAIGDAVHDYVKERFTRAHPDKMYAKWQCACGNTTTAPMVFNKAKDTICEDCGTPTQKHVELSLTDDEYEVSGSPDILLWLAEHRAFHIVEIKSIAASLFKELSRPIPDHVIQGSFYWRGARVRKLPVTNGVSILYVNKEFSFKLPYRELWVPQPIQEERLAPFLEELKILKEAKDGGPLPPRTHCPTIDSTEAKKCHVCVHCFQSGM